MIRLQALRRRNWEERTDTVQCDFKATARVFAKKGAGGSDMKPWGPSFLQRD